ncbi:MAG: hypothetical protein F2754_17095 [Actinobacteria bacterium]|uniref:Unannotated protein n=1 Tax=freshwater metagenome TaxID=449393 RepID=A0A6J7AV89_9ZZZZ|nr:hypothetical protein [Actinomycetota bacterium]MSX89101.1 hypothetical protein [Actinomycetota bacterium]
MTDTRLADIEEIRQLKARYFRLTDQKRWDEWLDVFVEDVRIDWPPDKGGAYIVGAGWYEEQYPQQTNTGAEPR